MNKGTQEETKLTKEKLKQFIKTRNHSDCYSNLQFGFDALNCGFDISELGRPIKYPLDNIFWGYRWETPFGILKEENGKLRLEQ